MFVPLHLPMITQRYPFLALCLALVLASVVACSNSGEEMRRQLNELQTRNQADSLMTDDSLALTLCDYFDSHGTPNEQMLAHYLLGRTYADMGEAPRALDEFHHAAECADTSSTDCDYHLLTRVHAQTANLFISQNMPMEALEELEYEYNCAVIANDTIARLCAFEQRHNVYDMMGESEKSIEILKQVHLSYLQYSLKEMAANCASVLAVYLIEAQQYDAAKAYMDEYESVFCDVALLYDCYKGFYYVGIEKGDSAEYYLRKVLRSSQDPNDIETVYRGLTMLYRSQNITDSIAKYSNLCYQLSETRFQESHAEELRHMQALYNYNRNQVLAAMKTIESNQNRHKYIVILIVSIFAIIILFSLILIIYKKGKDAQIRLRNNLKQEIDMQIKAKNELLQLQNKKYDELLSQKKEEVDKHQNAIEALRIALNPQDSVEPQLANTDIFKRFEYLSMNIHKRVYQEDWRQLCEMIDQNLPHFRNTLFSQCHLDEKDYHLCILIRLHFSLQQISILLSVNHQYMSKRRRYLLSKLFHQEGKPETFDKIIKSIS